MGFLPKLESYLYWFSCGYGERPLYSIYFSLFIILLFTALFLIVGINVDGEIVKYSDSVTLEALSFGKFFEDFMNAFSLSTGLFSGVGDEACEPLFASNIFADMEMLLGIILMGIGVGTLTRKIVR